MFLEGFMVPLSLIIVGVVLTDVGDLKRLQNDFIFLVGQIHNNVWVLSVDKYRVFADLAWLYFKVAFPVLMINLRDVESLLVDSWANLDERMFLNVV